MAAKVKLLEATVGDVARFVVDATGRTTVHQGGLEVVEGGARVQSGGLLVDDGRGKAGHQARQQQHNLLRSTTANCQLLTANC